jgi:S-ribosylhomocysteine lyase LuxS involved in autoinducer biosynthesis
MKQSNKKLKKKLKNKGKNKKKNVQKKKMKPLVKVAIGFASFIVLLFLGLLIYSSQAYHALPEMRDQIENLDTSSITIENKAGAIIYTAESPSKNIIFIPGGLVKPDAYSYLAVTLALQGYNVTIVKPLFHLAILTPNQAAKYIDDSMDNVIIGHSLGGVVASMVAAKNDAISTVILLGSYPIKDITDKHTLILTAEHDIAMDQEKFQNSLQYVNDDAQITEIPGANHAQFGWYGPQKGDGEADISTFNQQDLTIYYILQFLQNLN